MAVRLANETDKKAWDDFVLRHRNGLAYQLYAWKEATEHAYGFQTVYSMAIEDGKVCGVLPTVDFRVPLMGRSLISLPYCDAGGILAVNENVAEELLVDARARAKAMNACLKIRSTGEIKSCAVNQTDKVSMVLALPHRSNDLLASLKAKVRSQCQKPLRDGLTVKNGHIELLDDFYGVFTENMRDLGSPVHARHWFEEVLSAYKDRSRVIVVDTPEGEPAAAGLILLHPRRVSIPWASSLRRYNRLNPNMLLYWSCLAFAADNGYPQFDFGRSTPGEGTYRFKEQWGAKPLPLYWYEPLTAKIEKTDLKRPTADGRPSSKRQLAASIWQRLPQSSTDWLGPKVRKYISL
jgi:FemAB-related protein (PEP-CTERM system-associated)